MIVRLAADAPPLTPDDDTARRWLGDELSKPEYQAARPTWFDLLSQRVKDWFESLQLPGGGHASAGWLAVAAAVVVVGLLVAAFVAYGMPRLGRRAVRPFSGAVADSRSAAELRAAADAAASAGDWTLAVIERFRAIAQSLDERTVIRLRPGTTAHEVGRQAAPAFPVEAAALRDAADTFDRARYLGRAQSEADHARLRELDARLAQATPVLEAAHA
ncbi:DUF4129 domain-containing protein [Gryllotalpicola ginsengisoli]|uniref:DUF4129 domain-containing protein n=1 Tax=Gryllotalpicola ginsengisoli TaxID=444608 RepID=UPI0003B7750E|nr:DUF4129 domain-containing protein [Gryllotalpicola ginsengisoli]